MNRILLASIVILYNISSFSAQSSICAENYRKHLKSIEHELNATDELLLKNIYQRVYFQPKSRLSSIDKELISKYQLEQKITDLRKEAITNIKEQSKSKLKSKLLKMGLTTIAGGLTGSYYYSHYINETIESSDIFENYGFKVKAKYNEEYHFLNATFNCNPLNQSLSQKYKKNITFHEDGINYFGPMLRGKSIFDKIEPKDIFSEYILGTDPDIKKWEAALKQISLDETPVLDKLRSIAQPLIVKIEKMGLINDFSFYIYDNFSTETLRMYFNHIDTIELFSEKTKVLSKYYLLLLSKKIILQPKYHYSATHLNDLNKFELAEFGISIPYTLEQTVVLLQEEHKAQNKKKLKNSSTKKNLRNRISQRFYFPIQNRSYAHLYNLWDNTGVSICSRWGSEYQTPLNNLLAQELAQTLQALPTELKQHLVKISGGININSNADIYAREHLTITTGNKSLKKNDYILRYDPEGKRMSVFFHELTDDLNKMTANELSAELVTSILKEIKALDAFSQSGLETNFATALTCYLNKKCQKNSPSKETQALVNSWGSISDQPSKSYYQLMQALTAESSRQFIKTRTSEINHSSGIAFRVRTKNIKSLKVREEEGLRLKKLLHEQAITQEPDYKDVQPNIKIISTESKLKNAELDYDINIDKYTNTPLNILLEPIDKKSATFLEK